MTRYINIVSEAAGGSGVQFARTLSLLFMRGGIFLLIRTLTASFGRLEHQSLTLDEGLNILQAPNESGKSTWCAFLTAMLYGIDSRQRDRAGFLADKNRYAPWSGAPMQGRMDCRTDGGELTLLRETKRQNAPMGSFSALYAGTGDTVPQLTGQNCGERLLGVPREIFERSAFIRQAGLGVTQDAELERRIASLVTTGEEDTSYTEARAALNQQLNRRKHNKTGQIPELEAELSALEGQLESLSGRRTALGDLRRQARSAQERLAGLEGQLSLWESYKKAQRLRALQTAQADAAQAEHAAQLLRGRIREDRIPESETIGRLRGAADGLAPARQRAEQAEARERDARDAARQAEQAVQANPFAGKSAEEARREAAAPAPRLSRAVRNLPLFYILYGLLLQWLSRAILHLSYPVLLALGLIPGAAGAVVSIAACRRVRQAAAARLKRYGVSAPAQLPALAEAYCGLLAARDDAAAELSAASAAAEALHASLASGEQGLLAELRRFAPSFSDLSRSGTLLDECTARLEELARAEQAARETRLRRELLAQQLPEGGASAAEALPAAPPAQEEALLNAQARQTRAELAALKSRADQLSGEIAAIGDPALLAARADQLRGQLESLREEYDALTLSMEALDRANTALQNRFSPELGRRAAEIFSQLTGGRYSGVVLDKAFRLSAEPAGDSVYRDAQFLSAGALDQLYLAVRLAICQLVLGAENTVPLILDDALANFDDARCRAALLWLLRESEHRQILLFTCHTREAELLSGSPGVRIQELTDAPRRV
jgi:uncharacterized protein YhaN